MHAGDETLAYWRRPKPGGAWGLALPRKIFKFRVSEMPSPAFSGCHFQSIKTNENAVISCLLYPISNVIIKVQCLRQKRVKQWPHQGGYKQRARCVPFTRTNSAIMPSISITSLFLCMCRIARELHLSSVMVLLTEFVVSSYHWSYARLCTLTQDKSTKLWELHILRDRIKVGLVKSLNQLQGLWLHIRIHFTPLDQ